MGKSLKKQFIRYGRYSTCHTQQPTTSQIKRQITEGSPLREPILIGGERNE